MQQIMAANWKMYKTQAQAAETAKELCELLPKDLDRTVLIFPPFTSITAVAEAVKGNAMINVGGQNVFPASEGAYTGEISPQMLLDAKATWVLIGHSERRHLMMEAPEFIREKVKACLQSGLRVLLCVGETLEEREQGKLESVLIDQLVDVLTSLASSISPCNFAIAYEPVWAIGTGKVASPKDIAEAHGIVRHILEHKSSNAQAIAILYGGSVKPENAAEILAVENVDGVLVGGASLKADSFAKIVTA